MKKKIEFRYYEIPAGDYILPEIGKGWEREYGVEYKGMLHFHNYLEVGYCYHGSGDLIISDRNYRYGDEMFTIIPSNIPHTTESDEGNICKWEYLFIDLDNYIRNEMEGGSLSAEELIRIVNKRGTLKSFKNHRNCATIIRRMIEECRNQFPYYKESLKGLLRSLVIEILRLDEEKETGLKNITYDHSLDKAIKYIEDNYSGDIRIPDIADECGLSESHFRRQFEEITNMKPLDYVNMVRIRKACDLIKKGNMMMADVGRKVGFQTQSSFNRNFRALTGLTPLKWKHREKEEGGLNISDFKITAKKGWDAYLENGEWKIEGIE